MKKVFLFVCLIVSAASVAAQIYYVSPEGNGLSGLSWDDAISLEDALAKVEHGGEIWMKEGTYLSSSSGNRNESFVIPSGVAIFGGFKGHETSVAQRVSSAKTILSGDIGRMGDNSDNAFTVVKLVDADESTLLDNITITGGQSMEMTRDRNRTSAGGGLYIISERATSQPHIQNCTFIDNRARYGAAVYIDGTKNDAAPTFYNCQFISNTASFKGGGIYNDGESGRANSRITSCYFEANKADCGAGITNNGKSGESNPLIVESLFVANVSMVTGAAIYNQQGSGGDASPIIQSCQYERNESELNQDIADSERVTVASSHRHGAHSGGTLQPKGSRTTIAADGNK
ncbi:MAG: hypothetical protein AAF741_18425 [Bacteroidota bacterium]